MRIPVALWGATGVVGQRYALLLAGHPWFELVYLAASEQSVGKRYAEAVAGRWLPSAPIPPAIADLRIHRLDPSDLKLANCALLFSAAGEVADEEAAAQKGLGVISHLSAQRMREDIPLIIPEINGDHLDLLPLQQRRRGWPGWVVAKPNCSIQSYLLPLYALHKHYPVARVQVTTLQALSGGGLQAMGMRENVIPYIRGEEEKCEQEPLKILGQIIGERVEPAVSPTISAQCNRVPVVDGHLATVSVEFTGSKPSEEEIVALWKGFPGLSLPTAPLQPIHCFRELDRPQPLLDVDLERGMAISVGRLRPCSILDYRFVGLSHNAVRGAAGGGLLIAELAKELISRG